VACGGFSYGDVLGAGSGWAKSILFNNRLRDMFARFFARPETFTLGVCNGCQMVSQLKDIIPGASHWPVFTRNRSEQFEARYVTVEVLESPSVLLKGMTGSRIGIAVAHGEGFADFSRTGSAVGVKGAGLATLRYIDGRGQATERYPYNPNGSAGGLTGLTTEDGRVMVMMPHPDRQATARARPAPGCGSSRMPAASRAAELGAARSGGTGSTPSAVLHVPSAATATLCSAARVASGPPGFGTGRSETASENGCIPAEMLLHTALKTGRLHKHHQNIAGTY